MEPLICPGRICPETGFYVMITPNGRAVPYYRYVRAGDKMPPTAGPRMRYRRISAAGPLASAV